MEILTNVQVQNFLQDYKANAEVIFLEEGKEKNDLINSAKKRGILLENSRDLGALKTIYAFTDKNNSNGAILPAKEFQKILPQIIGKPMDIGHNRRYIVGFYIDYKFILQEGKTIAYAVFFKSNFPDEWEKAKTFQKKGKLSSSFEIWSDNTKTEVHKDGTYSLHRLEIAGGALIFEERGELPAFKDAKVLEIARKDLEECVGKACLVCASKYKEEEIIVAEKDYFKDSVIKNVEKLKEEKETPVKVEETKPKETPKVEEKKPEKEEEKKEVKPEPQSGKIKCSNCGEEIEYNNIDVRIKCPKCFAILNKEGTMQYPPQIHDFKVLCPSCKMNNWLILVKSDDKAKLRCSGCSKEYDVEFAKDDENTQKLIEKFNFVYTGSVSCPQCNSRIAITGVSSLKERTMKCPKCGIEFSFNISQERYKNIKSIKEIKSEKTIEKSKEGGKQMETKKVEKNLDKEKTEVISTSKAKTSKTKGSPKAKEKVATSFKCSCVDCGHTVTSDKHCVNLKCEKCGGQMRRADRPGDGKPEEKKVKVVKKAEAKVEDKKVETKVEETSKKEESKTEVKPEVKEKIEPKQSEKVEKAEAKVVEKDDELQADIQYEATFGEPESDYPTVEKAKEEVVEKPNRYKNAVRKAVKKVMDIKKALKKTKADKAKMEEILKSGVNKVAKKYLELKKSMDEKINFYKENAKTIHERRKELGEFATKLTDEQLIDNKDYEIAKLNKTVAEKEDEKQPEVASETVGDKKKNNDYYSGIKNKINANAFPENKENKK